MLNLVEIASAAASLHTGEVVKLVLSLFLFPVLGLALSRCRGLTPTYHYWKTGFLSTEVHVGGLVVRSPWRCKLSPKASRLRTS